VGTTSSSLLLLSLREKRHVWTREVSTSTGSGSASSRPNSPNLSVINARVLSSPCVAGFRGPKETICSIQPKISSLVSEVRYLERRREFHREEGGRHETGQ
jgi:hypothetical protein